MNTLILYYSNKGNNRYISQRLSVDLNCQIEEIIPKNKTVLTLLFATLIKTTIRTKEITHSIHEYDNIILCGPIWMGQIAAPIYSFLKINQDKINNLYIVNCCGGTETDKDSKFGYQSIFNKIQQMVGPKLKKSYPISTGLMIDESKREETNIAELRINDSNFEGKIRDQYEKMVEELRHEFNMAATSS
jgi:flavodoxin